MKSIAAVLGLALQLGAPAQQPPRLASGKIESRAASGSLAQQIRGVAGPAWVGYTMAAVPGQRGCCMSINNGVCSYGCALEGGSMTGVSCPANQGDNTVFLEGERSVNILFRVDQGEIERVRAFSPSCQLDISNLTLHWLTGVQPSDSVALLKTLTTQRSNSALSAIAAHADPSADAYLKEVAESQTALRRDRERAANSLAHSRGAAGMAIVTKLLESDPDEQFRASLPGAIAQAPGNAGTSTLIDIATKDKSRKVREKAFFWLGRSSDIRAQKFV